MTRHRTKASERVPRWMWLSAFASCVGVLALAALLAWTVGRNPPPSLSKAIRAERVRKILETRRYSPKQKGPLLLKYIRPGMTDSEVEELLGAPHSSALSGRSRFWYYPDYGVDIVLRDRRVVEVYAEEQPSIRR